MNSTSRRRRISLVLASISLVFGATTFLRAKIDLRPFDYISR